MNQDHTLERIMQLRTSFIFFLFAWASRPDFFVDATPNINDPDISLDFFIRTEGSTDPQVTSVSYWYGPIFAKLPGKPLQKLFNFEGYNINRKEPKEDGSYQSLSREFSVYRDPSTNEILTVWTNPWTRKQNEVFYVANDPVNMKRALLVYPTKLLPKDRIIFNIDILLSYPNPLQPKFYPNYSAGPIYQAAELFGFFANLSSLVNDTESIVPMTGTWVRRSQFLPWMEMGTTKGELYYATFFWKCHDMGLQCVSDDIMAIINENFTEYKEAPVKVEVPNKTSWRVFKAVVDKRRETGLPDIIIPKSDGSETPNITQYETGIDQRITEFFQREKRIHVYLNGTAWSQIVGNRSVNIFNVEGNVLATVTEPIGGSGFYTVSLRGAVFYRDIQTGNLLKIWNNPLTDTLIDVPNPLVLKEIKFEFPKEFVYSMTIPSSGDIGLLAAQSSEIDTNSEDWSVNFFEIIFDRGSFGKLSDVFFFGTAVKFSDWPDWMKMGTMPGNIVVKATIYRDSQSFPYEALFTSKGSINRVNFQFVLLPVFSTFILFFGA